MSNRIVSKTYSSNETAKLSDMNISDFTHPLSKIIKSWNTESNGSGISYPVDFKFKLNSDVTLYAQWGYPDFTWTYLSNNGANLSKVYTYDYSSEIVVPDPNNIGYNPPSDDKEFSHWGVKEPELKYKIIFDSNGGSAATKTETYTYVENVNQSRQELVSAGYWVSLGVLSNTQALSYYNYGYNGHRVSIQSTSNHGGHFLVSYYVDPVYRTVTYTTPVTRTGTRIVEDPKPSIIVSLGFSFIINDEKNPTRSGYIFDGWNTKPDGSGIVFKSNVYYLLNFTSNITLYAMWRKSSDPSAEGNTIYQGRIDATTKLLPGQKFYHQRFSYTFEAIWKDRLWNTKISIKVPISSMEFDCLKGYEYVSVKDNGVTFVESDPNEVLDRLYTANIDIWRCGIEKKKRHFGFNVSKKIRTSYAGTSEWYNIDDDLNYGIGGVILKTVTFKRPVLVTSIYINTGILTVSNHENYKYSNSKWSEETGGSDFDFYKYARCVGSGCTGLSNFTIDNFKTIMYLSNGGTEEKIVSGNGGSETLLWRNDIKFKTRCEIINSKDFVLNSSKSVRVEKINFYYRVKIGGKYVYKLGLPVSGLKILTAT